MKIVLGMSGGVDSAVAAYLLQEAGHQVYGVTLHMTDAAPPDIDGARATADRLQIPHTVVDCRESFRNRIEAQFAYAYQIGETPNPCVICNREVKLAALQNYAAEHGCDAIATGHYARIAMDAQGNRILLRGTDPQKDQSYMLYRITQKQLSQIVLPLGDLTKDVIRRIAAEQQLLPSIPHDSMDICFIPSGDYAEYLRNQHGFVSTKGLFLAKDGQKLGTHTGQWQFTVGQRKGLGLACGTPVYVLEKDASSNAVTVGAHEDLFASRCRIRDCSWLTLPNPHTQYTAKIRYSRGESAAWMEAFDGKTAVLQFTEPQRAMSKGQSAVIYAGEQVIGGGLIDAILPDSAEGGIGMP